MLSTLEKPSSLARSSEQKADLPVSSMCTMSTDGSDIHAQQLPTVFLISCNAAFQLCVVATDFHQISRHVLPRGCYFNKAVC